MKIIMIDNFGQGGEVPGRDDKVVAHGITDERFADAMCAALVEKFSGDSAPVYFKVVPDDYRLAEFAP
jgi:hypothetical protein